MYDITLIRAITTKETNYDLNFLNYLNNGGKIFTIPYIKIIFGDAWPAIFVPPSNIPSSNTIPVNLGTIKFY